MGLFLAFIASLFAAFNAFAQKKSLVGSKSGSGFVVFQLFTAFFLFLAMSWYKTLSFSLGPTLILLAGFGGLILGTLTFAIAKTLENGPAGLTFAFVNSASIVPALAFFLFFGPSFGYPYTIWNGLGSILVVIGLFLAARFTNEKGGNRGWKKYVSLSFLAHALFLGFLALWALIIKGEHPLLAKMTITEEEQIWFMPIVAFVAATIQLFVFLVREKRLFFKNEVLYGIGGGLCQGLCTYFIFLAPQKAASWENAMLFPFYAVLVIIACNLWSQIFYKEKVHWKANALAFSGLVLGTLGS